MNSKYKLKRCLNCLTITFKKRINSCVTNPSFKEKHASKSNWNSIHLKRPHRFQSHNSTFFNTFNPLETHFLVKEHLQSASSSFDYSFPLCQLLRCQATFFTSNRLDIEKQASGSLHSKNLNVKCHVVHYRASQPTSQQGQTKFQMSKVIEAFL